MPDFDSAGAGNATATSGATLDLACPATVNAGDLLIAHTAYRAVNRGMAPTAAEQSNGWVPWRGNAVAYSAGASPTGRHFLHMKIADGTEGGDTISFDVLNAGVPNNSTTTPRHGRIYRVTGNNPGTITADTDGDVLGGFSHAAGDGTTLADNAVTTDEDDCLAFNIVYIPDDSEILAFTGETGGDWVEPVDQFQTTLGNDGTNGILVADMPTAGTINGGTSTTSADPYGIFGFFVRPAAGAGAFEIDAQPGSYALTGAAAGVLAGRVINAAPGSYALTGFAALLQRGRFINAEPGSYALTGAQAGVLATRLINAAAGSYSLTGAPIGAVAGRVLVAEPGSYEYTGFAAELVYDTGAQAFELNAEPGTYALTGADTGLLAGRMIVAAPGSYSLTGAQAGLLVDRVLNAEPGAYTLTGAPASTLAGRVLVALPGEYSLTGFLAGLVQEGVAVYIPPAEGEINIVQASGQLSLFGPEGTIEIIRPEGVFSIVQDAEGGIVVIGPEGEIWLII